MSNFTCTKHHTPEHRSTSRKCSVFYHQLENKWWYHKSSPKYYSSNIIKQNYFCGYCYYFVSLLFSFYLSFYIFTTNEIIKTFLYLPIVGKFSEYVLNAKKGLVFF